MQARIVFAVFTALGVSATTGSNPASGASKTQSIDGQTTIPTQVPAIYLRPAAAGKPAGTWDICGPIGCSTAIQICGTFGCIETKYIIPPWTSQNSTTLVQTPNESSSTSTATFHKPTGIPPASGPPQCCCGPADPGFPNCIESDAIISKADQAQMPLVAEKDTVEQTQGKNSTVKAAASQKADEGLKLCGHTGCISTDTLSQHLASLVQKSQQPLDVKSEL